MTPAQVSGQSFVTDVAAQGPTDAGQREAACRWAASLPKGGTCVDCSGVLPPWLRSPGMLGERVELLGRPICCFN